MATHLALAPPGLQLYGPPEVQKLHAVGDTLFELPDLLDKPMQVSCCGHVTSCMLVRTLGVAVVRRSFSELVYIYIYKYHC